MSYQRTEPPMRPIQNRIGVRMLVPVHRSYKPPGMDPLLHIDYLMVMAELRLKKGIQVVGGSVQFQMNFGVTKTTNITDLVGWKLKEVHKKAAKTVLDEILVKVEHKVKCRELFGEISDSDSEVRIFELKFLQMARTKQTARKNTNTQGQLATFQNPNMNLPPLGDPDDTDPADPQNPAANLPGDPNAVPPADPAANPPGDPNADPARNKRPDHGGKAPRAHPSASPARSTGTLLKRHRRKLEDVGERKLDGPK